MTTAEEVGVRLSLSGQSQFNRGLGESATGVKALGAEVSRSDGILAKASKGGFSLLEKAASALFTALKYAAIAGVGVLSAAVAIGVKQASAMQTAMAQTNAVLASTGGVAHVTSGHVLELAKSVQSYSGIQDVTVQGAENMLLGFTNVRNQVGAGNNVFDRATTLATDLSVRLGRDLPTSALALGKALQDPIKGMTNLRRVGVAFTASQQDQIKTLVNSGNLLGAQNLILNQLQKEFGGAAAAAGKTLPGAWARFKASGKDALGTIITQAENFAGVVLTKPLDKAATWFAKFTTSAPKYLQGVEDRWTILQKSGFGNITSAKGWAAAIDNVVGGNGKLIPILTRVVTTIEDFWRFGKAALPTVLEIATAVGVTLLAAWTGIDTVVKFLSQHSTILKPLLYGLAGGFVALEAVGGAIAAVKGIASAGSDLQKVYSAVSNLFGSKGAGGVADAAKAVTTMTVTADSVIVNGGVGAGGTSIVPAGGGEVPEVTPVVPPAGPTLSNPTGLAMLAFNQFGKKPTMSALGALGVKPVGAPKKGDKSIWGGSPLNLLPGVANSDWAPLGGDLEHWFGGGSSKSKAKAVVPGPNASRLVVQQDADTTAAANAASLKFVTDVLNIEKNGVAGGGKNITVVLEMDGKVVTQQVIKNVNYLQGRK